MGQITRADLKKAFPHRQAAITQELIDIFNESLEDAEFQGESLLSSAVTYESVINGSSRASFQEYIIGIKFCAYLMNEDNITESYCKAFAHRDFVKARRNKPAKSKEYKELTSAASRYRRSKLITDILTVSQVPLDILFTGVRYRAVQKLVEEMETAPLAKDRINAANFVLVNTKGPDLHKIDLNLGVNESKAVEQLNEQLTLIAAKQKALLEGNVIDLNTIGAVKLNAEIEDAEYTENR